MTQQEELQADTNDFDAVLALGYAAYEQGDVDGAEQAWQQAAMLDPHNETVWLALLQICRTDEDRYVCLQNIVSINPKNEVARNELLAYELPRLQEQRRAEYQQQARSRRVLWVFSLLFALIFGVAMAFVVFRIIF